MSRPSSPMQPIPQSYLESREAPCDTEGKRAVSKHIGLVSRANPSPSCAASRTTAAAGVLIDAEVRSVGATKRTVTVTLSFR